MPRERKPDSVSRKRLDAPIALEAVIENIRDPKRWVELKQIRQLIIENPSLRGMLYGYVAEAEFVGFLHNLGLRDHFKADDHKKTKSDRTVDYRGRQYTIQLKSIQTNSIKAVGPGEFTATVQNDASDRRTIRFKDGSHIETTCYLAGEYDILGVSLQPFTATWRFAFKKNRDLRRTTHKNYTPAMQKVLLATLEKISFPLTSDWTEDLFSLLQDRRIGKAR